MRAHNSLSLGERIVVAIGYLVIGSVLGFSIFIFIMHNFVLN